MSRFVAGTSPVVSYTKIPNCLIRDRRISEGAFRLICWVSSHTPDFEFSFESIKKALGYGREKLRSIIKESEAANYLVRLRIRLGNGSFDWQYHVFLDPDDAIAYKNTIGGKAVCGEPGGVNPPVAEPVYGSDPPYIEEQCKKNKLKKQLEEDPPIVPRENANIPMKKGGGETHVVVAEVVTQDEEVTVKQSLVVQSSIPPHQEQIVPAHENNNQTQDLRPIQRIFEESGKIINYGTEYKDWIQADMGDVIKHYRRSGRALTTSPNDVDPDFKNFTAVNANNGKGMKLSAIQGWVVNCEKDPLRWGELRDLVAEWVLAKTTGDRFTNIAQEINRDAKQQATANNLMSMLSDRLSQRSQP